MRIVRVCPLASTAVSLHTDTAAVVAGDKRTDRCLLHELLARTSVTERYSGLVARVFSCCQTTCRLSMLSFVRYAARKLNDSLPRALARS